MAERIQVELVDDIDGSPAKHTVIFALDGVTYEIDLNDGHAKELRSVFDRYIAKARAPESAPVAKAKQQREREDENHRRANKQLTEQIRGAAQRSRDQLNRQKPADSASAEQNSTGPEENRPVADAAATDSQETRDERTPVERSVPDSSRRAAPQSGVARSETAQPEKSLAEESAEQDDAAGPAVALPLFSSAAD